MIRLFELHGVAFAAARAAQIVDRAIARHRKQPWPDRALLRIEAVNTVPHAQKSFLHQVFRDPAVARNRAIDYLRSAGGRERNAVEFEETDHPALYCDMEKDLLSADKARRVKSAVEKLTPNQRQVIELAYFEGLSQTEMAVRMGQPLGTVKTWVRTALKNLRDELAVVSA